jgi:hypothetical protein
VLLFATSSSWAAADIKELTKDNLNDQSFDFKFETADYWFLTVFKVTVRPKREQLSAICDRIGGRFDRCQETANQFGLQMGTGFTGIQKNGSLIYTFRAPRGTHKCFYFWWNCGESMPCMDIWWVSPDSPLWRGNETPK